jgi:hypothetical protein
MAIGTNDVENNITVKLGPRQQLSQEIKVSKYSTVQKMRELTGIFENPPTETNLGLLLSYAITFTQKQFPLGYFESLDVDTQELLVSLCGAHMMMKNRIAGSLYTGITSYNVGSMNVSKHPLAIDANKLWENYLWVINSVRPAQAKKTGGREVTFADGSNYI